MVMIMIENDALFLSQNHFLHNNFVQFHKASVSERDAQLRAEIKQLLKEASTLSEPSTFAQSAKLRRLAVAKEKELSKSQESASKEIKTSFSMYEKILMISKVVIYLTMIVCFWRIHVAAISKELVQPFDIIALMLTTERKSKRR